MKNVKALLPLEYITLKALNPAWKNSWAKDLVRNPIKVKGKKYELITEHFLTYKGYDVRPRIHSSHDRIIDGKTAEIKGASSSNGIFSFMQIRPKQGYQKLIFMAVHPDKVEFYEFDHKKVKRFITNGTFKPQHGGKENNGKLKDTYMFIGTLDRFSQQKMFEMHSSEFMQ